MILFYLTLLLNESGTWTTLILGFLYDFFDVFVFKLLLKLSKLLINFTSDGLTSFVYLILLFVYGLINCFVLLFLERLICREFPLDDWNFSLKFACLLIKKCESLLKGVTHFVYWRQWYILLVFNPLISKIIDETIFHQRDFMNCFS